MAVTTKAKRKTKGVRQPTLVGNHLVVDPRVCHGALTFRGTRVPVETILCYLATGHSLAYLRKSWPEVSAEAIQEAISLASDHLIQHYRRKKS
jgi:uncharacterized protein (DUF433 family)